MTSFLRRSIIAPLCIALIALTGCTTTSTYAAKLTQLDPRCTVGRPSPIPPSAPTADSGNLSHSVSANAQWDAAVQEASLVAKQMSAFTPSADNTAAFRAKYGAWMHNPFNATALMSQLNAKALYTFIAAVAPGSYGGTTWALDHDILLRDLGTMIALSTGGQNLSTDMSTIQEAFDELRTDDTAPLASRINSHINNALSSYREQGEQEFLASNISGSTAQPTVGHTIFTQTVGMASASNPNLTLGAGFYTSSEGNNPSIATDLLTWDALALHHRRFEHTPREIATANTDTRSTIIISESDRTVSDPLHAIYLASDTPLHAVTNKASRTLEARRLNALRTFLASNTPFPVRTNDTPADAPQSTELSSPLPVNTARYLTGTRGQNTFANLGFEDCGDTFGKMLFDATRKDPSPNDTPTALPLMRDFPTHDAYRDALAQWDSQQRERIDTVRVAAGFLEGYQDGLDRSHGIADTQPLLATRGGMRLYGYRNPLLRSWAGSILAPHIEGIAHSLAAPIGGDASWAPSPRSQEPIIAFGEPLFRRLRGPQSMFLDLHYDDPAPLGVSTVGNTPILHFEGGRAPAIEVLQVGAEQALAQDVSDTPLTNQAVQILSRSWTDLYFELYFIPSESAEVLRSMHDAHIKRTQYLNAQGITIGTTPDPASFDRQTAVPDTQIVQLREYIKHNRSASSNDSLRSVEEVVSTATSRAYFTGVSRSKSFVIPQSWIEQSDPERLTQIPVDATGALLDYTVMSTKQRAFFEQELLNSSLTYDFEKPFILTDRYRCSFFEKEPQGC